MTTEQSSLYVVRLLDRLRTGDPAARDELYLEASRRLQALARHRLWRHHRDLRGCLQTDDVTQDALWRLHRYLDKSLAHAPSTERHFHNLLGQILRRTMYDLADRYCGPHGWATNNAGQPTEVRPAGWPSARDALEVRDALQAVERLSEELREVLNLIVYRGLTYRETAAVTGTSPATVMRRYREALHQLRVLLRTAEEDVDAG